MRGRSTTDDWETLGRADPLWAVFVTPGARGGGWDLDAFLATGRAEVKRVLGRMTELSPETGRDHVLDFGCGVGRLSVALADHFDRVTGVDAAPAMLDQARQIAGGRCTFVLNKAPDVSFLPDGSVDVAYSSLVLQHLPRDQALAYLRDLVRVTRADGCVVVQVAERPDWSLKGMTFRFAPRPVISWAQRQLLGYPAPMLMTSLSDRLVRATVADAGASVLAAEPDESYGGHWRCTRYYVHPG
jgi:SAM-dependent methyltransferase